MSKLVCRVEETIAAFSGTGSYTPLGGATTGFQTFLAGVGNNKTCPYIATDGVDWESGIGTYSTSGNTLARTKILHSSNSDAAVNWVAADLTIWIDAPPEFLVVDPSVAGGRLTTSSTLAVTPPSQAASTDLFYLPCVGNKIAGYDGTGWRLHTIPDAGWSLDVTGLTADHNYDIYFYEDTETLEAVDWSAHGAGSSTRTTAIVRTAGVWTKTGALSRRLLGTIRTISSGGVTKCIDAVGFRYVSNVQNRAPFRDWKPETTDSWTPSGTNGTWSAINSTAALPWKHGWVNCLDRTPVTATIIFAGAYNGTGPVAAIGINSVTPDRTKTSLYTNNSTAALSGTATFASEEDAGYHYLQGVETTTASGGTQAIAAGDNGGTVGAGVSGIQAGMTFSGER